MKNNLNIISIIKTEESSIIGGDSYLPPRIGVVEVSVEKGFADSATDFGDSTW